MKKILFLGLMSLVSVASIAQTLVQRFDFYNIEHYENGNVKALLSALENGNISTLAENLADTNGVDLELVKQTCSRNFSVLRWSQEEHIRHVHQPGVNPANGQYWIERTYYASEGKSYPHLLQVRLVMDRYYRIKNVLFFENEKIIRREVLLRR
ncbi:MAG: hypothetical protein MUF42_02795 [Cytophagaceae bacterium]|jgi:hypothetical protein|nr:hypothetical protein [Cytophagaceae bacterium]